MTLYEPDLVALVLEIRALVPTHIANHMGRAVQHFGLMVLNETDPDLAQEIHDRDDLKPFTVSGFMTDDGLFFGDVNEGDQLWIRITGASQAVSTALIAYQEKIHKQLASQQKVIVRLNHLPWAVAGICMDEHLWAGNFTYATFVERHRNARPPCEVTLQFLSPTTFNSMGANTPLPLPPLVFGSLLSRWIAFTDHRLRDLPDNQLDAFFEHHISIIRYSTATEQIRGKARRSVVGFSGEVCYEIHRKSTHLQKHQPELEALLRREHRWFARTVGLLADFAFYSGIGRKTATGMGTAREIP